MTVAPEPPGIDGYVIGIAVLAVMALGALLYGAKQTDPSGQMAGVAGFGLCVAGIFLLCKRICDLLERTVWSRRARAG